MKLEITAFAGERPRVAGHLLPNENAVLAKNTRLTDGRLRPYRQLKQMQSLSATPKTLYPYRDSGNLYWMDWTQDVDVVRSPIADDPNNRIYMSGTVQGVRFTDNQLALSGGSDYPVNTRQLGIPEPVAPVATVTGTATGKTIDAETRAYTYTWVDENGREGPPGLPSASVVVVPGESVQLVVAASPGAIDLNVTHFRVYVSTASGTWALCTQVDYSGTVATDIPAGNTTITDKTPVNKRGAILKTTGWNAPAHEMKGLVVMAGGVAVGFHGKELLFSEPYHLYAWPPAYRLTLDYEIRSLAVTSNSVVIGTEGKPYVAFGTEPSSMTLEQLDSSYVCVSKRSMVDMGEMALYASPNGLVRIAGGVPDLLTRNVINPEDWRQRFKPETLHGTYHDGKYFGFYNDGALDGSGSGGFIFNPEDGHFTELDFYADAAVRDLEDDALYLAMGTELKQWNEGTGLLDYQWRSKVYQGKPVKFNSARVLAQSYSNLRFRLYRDDVLVMEQPVTSDRGFRLPPGRGARWQVELAGTDTVFSVAMASSMGEL